MNNVGFLNSTRLAQAIEDLKELVAIPSVSHPNSPDYDKQHLKKAAEYAGSKLTNLGFKVSYVSVEDSAPFVIAERIIDASKPTFLFYSHYDVQPVDRQHWKSNPFALEEIDGRLYGRGASDDKGGMVAIMAAVKYCIEEGVESPNIKILFEGEEEYHSVHLNALLKQEAQRIQAEALVVLDGLNRDVNTGTLTSSARGIVNLELEVNALEKPVHSGIGCILPDPAQDLAELICSIRNPHEIPGFMDGCEELNETEKQILKKTSISAETYANEMGLKSKGQLRGDTNQSVYERIVSEPSITIINMTSGQKNGGNSVQDKARCTISIRVLPGQDPDKVAESVINYLKSKKLKSGLEVKITQTEKGARAWKANLSAPYAQLYLDCLKESFPEVCAMPCGGAIPLLDEFKQAFPKAEIIVPGVEDPKTDAHSHNESQDIKVFKRQIETVIHFLKRTGQLKI